MVEIICDGGEIADQCRALGLVVGDTIEGREADSGGYWQETRLTLLWIGECEAVWSERGRSNTKPEWSAPCETVDWTLDCREWHKLSNAEMTGAVRVEFSKFLSDVLTDLQTEIDRLRAELKNIRDANPLNWDSPHNDTATFMEWAKSRARFALSPPPMP